MDTEIPPLAPKTAASTNEVPPPDAPPTRVGLATAQVGWWNVDSTHAGHKGTKEDVIARIEACERIPAHWKAALLAEIRDMKCAAVEVHAHCTPDKGAFDLNVKLKPLF